jgi:hypothetical protein
MSNVKQSWLLLLAIGAIILGIGAIIVALVFNTAISSNSNSGTLTIFFNKDTLILYIPNTISSLKGFAFEVIYDEAERRIVELSEFEELTNLSLEHFPSPACILFYIRDKTLPHSLAQCSDITSIIQPVSASQSVFWLNPSTQLTAHLRILSGVNVIGQCEPNTFCSVGFTAEVSQ